MSQALPGSSCWAKMQKLRRISCGIWNSAAAVAGALGVLRKAFCCSSSIGFS
jgi:hypothetical protein